MKTYTTLPPDMRSVFAEIISEVETNLVTDSVHAEDIQNVEFRSETYLELIKRLSVDGEAGVTKYPLVCLLRNYDIEYPSDGSFPIGMFTIIIVTPSHPDKLSSDRELSYYIPILRPIYAELMNCIYQSRFFVRTPPIPEHRYTETFKFGDPSNVGNTAYRLPDTVDAIIVDRLRLKIDTEECVGITLSPALTVSYLNVVQYISTRTTGFGIEITIAQAQYYNGLVANPGYDVYLSHNESTASILINTATSFDIEAEDGLYYGYVSCDDGYYQSRLYFAYEVSNGAVLNTVNVNNILLDGLTGNELAETYPVTLYTQTRYTAKEIDSVSISVNGGNEIYSRSWPDGTTDTTPIQNIVNVTQTTNPTDVTYQVVIGEVILESVAYYKLTQIL